MRSAPLLPNDDPSRPAHLPRVQHLWKNVTEKLEFSMTPVLPIRAENPRASLLHPWTESRQASEQTCHLKYTVLWGLTEKKSKSNKKSISSSPGWLGLICHHLQAQATAILGQPRPGNLAWQPRFVSPYQQDRPGSFLTVHWAHCRQITCGEVAVHWK